MPRAAVVSQKHQPMILLALAAAVTLGGMSVAVRAQDETPLASPFGPGWDPTRPPPQEPKETGAGIVAATLVASGAADIEEQLPGPSPFFGVVLDVRIAAGSTTPVLAAASVVAEREGGPAAALAVACTPTQNESLSVYHGAGARLAAWNIAIDGRTWLCGGRTGRMAVRVGAGGLRLTTSPGAAWNGPLVLLFEAAADSLRRVVLPGATVDLTAPKKTDDKVN